MMTRSFRNMITYLWVFFVIFEDIFFNSAFISLQKKKILLQRNLARNVYILIVGGKG